ncbi:MAG TPA: DUF2378 family protein [Ignavibacteria bacterium]|jgi:uncharacterized protein (TIGR02265 family)
MSANKPTIKGVFVNSHITTLKNQRGEDAFLKLTEQFGKPPIYKNSENVNVSDEVKIIEICLDLLSDSPIPEYERSFQAGRLHFRNFSLTPLGRIIFSVFRHNFKLLMKQTKYLAGHVFQGVEFSSEEMGEKSIKVIMKNNDYPIEHFRGLFTEWMEFSGLTGTVDAKQIPPNTYEYIMKWQ